MAERSSFKRDVYEKHNRSAGPDPQQARASDVSERALEAEGSQFFSPVWQPLLAQGVFTRSVSLEAARE